MKPGMLINVSYKKDQVVDPLRIGTNEFLRKLQRTRPKSYPVMIETVDSALGELKPSKNSALIYTFTGSLLGNSSSVPNNKLIHFWENISKVFGEDKTALKAVGSFLRWRIADRAMMSGETWLLYEEVDEERRDPDTGKKIKISKYWIDNDYFPDWLKAPSKSSIGNLASKWGASLR